MVQGTVEEPGDEGDKQVKERKSVTREYQSGQTAFLTERWERNRTHPACGESREVKTELLIRKKRSTERKRAQLASATREGEERVKLRSPGDGRRLCLWFPSEAVTITQVPRRT